ncbi:MAG TPA: hypothetical protein VM165_23760 [Planctomycetaceae bacterium]|nr:hypothetical protein [Planctomycetaceae bacterium]
MTISIITCPKCNAMVLSDAARCHVCEHNFADQVVEHVPQVLPTDHLIADDLHVCKHCGETYRTGLVRCWNCGKFTREEIKAAYDDLLAGHGDYAKHRVNLPELAPQTTTRSGPWKFEVTKSAPKPVAGDNDGSISASDDDFAFELADSVQLEESRSRTMIPEDGYTLATALPEINDAPEPAIPAQAEEAIPTATEATAPPSNAKPAAEAEGASHSEATGGDALLDIAKAEELDIQQTRKQLREKVTFVVYCPMGCRVRVQDRHRGRAGKCPKCGSTFFVPKATPKSKAVTPAGDFATITGDPNAVAKWRNWMEDVHLHAVVPQKLRIKADSLKNDFGLVDLAFSSEGLLILTLVKAAGFMGANLKKKPAIRQAAQEQLKGTGKLDGLAVGAQRLIPTASLSQLAMGQPSPPDVESLFGNIPVFGAGRIAVRLPKTPDATQTDYLTFSLSEFRKFTAALESVAGIAGFGGNTEVPVVDTYNTLKCHYSDVPVKELLGLDYYQKDPAFKLQITGWRCGGCSLVVSEDARKKEKIGGLNGKAIAKAKCPKCPAKFGDHPLYEVNAATPEAAPAAPAAPSA